MAGPTSPGAEGPTFAPPHPPPGWIAQWDGSSRKYYFVQLSTGVSQWEVPTEAASSGTPAPDGPFPYGMPPQPELITHPDGTQTIRHADGTMEPIMPPPLPDGTRDGPDGQRGLTSVAVNALLGGGKHGSGHNSSSPLGLAQQFLGGGHGSHGSGNQHGSSASPLGLAQQFLGGGGHGSGSHGNNQSHGGNQSHGSSGQGHGGKSSTGKLVSALASSLLNSGHGNKPQPSPSYHGSGPSANAQHGSSGGLTGSLMGGVASMFGGKPHSNSHPNYGYSDAGSGGYSGHAPPTTYQPSGPSSSSGGSPGSYPPSQQHGYGAPGAPGHTPQPPYPHQSPPGAPHDPSQQYPPAHFNSFNQPSYSPYPGTQQQQQQPGQYPPYGQQPGQPAAYPPAGAPQHNPHQPIVHQNPNYY